MSKLVISITGNLPAVRTLVNFVVEQDISYSRSIDENGDPDFTTDYVWSDLAKERLKTVSNISSVSCVVCTLDLFTDEPEATAEIHVHTTAVGEFGDTFRKFVVETLISDIKAPPKESFSSIAIHEIMRAPQYFKIL
jgi:hypothetical protein